MAATYNSYFNKISKLDYDINGSIINPKFENVTNIFFRIRYVKEVLNNMSSYYVMEIEDGDTPEILAEKIYGDAGAGWMITLANDIIDPQSDWPLDYESFRKYIIDKYGTIETAQTTYHHFEKVVTRTINGQSSVEFRYNVSENKLTGNDLNVPHEYYNRYYKAGLWRYPEIDYTADTDKYSSDNDPPTGDAEQDKYSVDETLYTIDQTDLTVDIVLGREGQSLSEGSLARTQSVSTYEFEGDTIQEIIRGNAVSYYDYENEVNERKRLIKVIKKEYYDRVQNEFDRLTNYVPSFLRVVR